MLASSPLRPDPAQPHGHPQAAPAAAAAGSGVRRGDRSGAGPAVASSPAGGTLGPGASRPPSRGAPFSRARWHRGGSRGREEAGGVGSVRPICSGPEGLPSTCSPGRPPASLAVAGVTAASARQLLLPAFLPTPGLRELHLCLPDRASALGILLLWRKDWVWTRPEARWSHDLNLGPRLGKSSPRQLWDPNIHVRLKWALVFTCQQFPTKHFEYFSFVTET